jgi:hypothetical protein
VSRVGELELTTRRQLVRTLVAMIKQLNEQIKEVERQITTAIREHPDGEIFLSLFKGSVITAAELLAEIGDCRARYPHRDRSRATPVMPRSRSSEANAKQRAFAGAATSGCARRSASWPTAPATGTPGHKRCTPTRSPGATTTPAQSAPSAAPGVASSGDAGRTASPMTRRATAHCGNGSPSSSPPQRGPVVDHAATVRMAAGVVAPHSSDSNRVIAAQ